MSQERVKELQDFVEDFKGQLAEAKELYLQKKSQSKTIEPKHFKAETINNKIYVPKLKKKTEKINLNNLHWIPNCLFGKSLDKFKRLNNGHNLTSWELVFNNLYNN
jgi:hypothetical protein